MAFTHDCIIIGGGPAGLTAAIYLQRFRRSSLVVDRGNARVNLAPRIRNLVGYTEGIPGRVLLKRLRRQALQFNATIIQGEGLIYRQHKGFEVHVGHTVFSSKFVILATGLKDIQPYATDFLNLCQKDVLAYCPICDGFDHRDKKIGVFINSQAGFKKVKFIHGFSKNLHAIVIKDIKISAKQKTEMRKLGIKIHQDRLKQLVFNPKSQKLIVKLESQRAFEIDLGYVELGIQIPHQAIRHLHGLRKTKEKRYLTNKHQETSIKGLYAIGDCSNSLAQVSVAVGEAAVAATHIHARLRANQSERSIL